MKKQRVLITGRRGQLGTAMAERLARSVEFEVAYDDDERFPDCYRTTNRGEIDVSQLEGVQALVKYTAPDIILHTAALVSSEWCEKDWQKAITTNVHGSANVAFVAREIGAKLVYFSTTAIYDPVYYAPMGDYLGDLPITEEHPIAPLTHYGFTKWLGEKVVTEVMLSKQLLVIRPCFVYGSRLDHASEIGKIIRFKKYGDQISPIRLCPRLQKDYLYITDFVEALHHLLKRDPIGVFNISRGTPVSWREVLNILEEELGSLFGILIVPKDDYLRDHVVSNAKLQEYTGWEPSVSLEEGIKRAIEEI